MPNPWFRLYAEILDDEKVQMMPFDFQRHLVMLFALRCQRDTSGMTNQQIAFRLRVDETFLKRLHETFLKHGFIEEDWTICNWNKRQFLSDSSTDRVRLHRARHRENKAMKQYETLQKRNETVTVTAPDTEQIQNRTDTEEPFALGSALPKKSAAKKGTRFPDGYQPNEEHKALSKELGIDLRAEFPKFRDHWLSVAGAKGVKLDWDATLRVWIRNAQQYQGTRTHQSNGGSNGRLDRYQENMQYIERVFGGGAEENSRGSE